MHDLSELTFNERTQVAKAVGTLDNAFFFTEREIRKDIAFGIYPENRALFDPADARIVAISRIKEDFTLFRRFLLSRLVKNVTDDQAYSIAMQMLPGGYDTGRIGLQVKDSRNFHPAYSVNPEAFLSRVAMEIGYFDEQRPGEYPPGAYKKAINTLCDTLGIAHPIDPTVEATTRAAQYDRERETTTPQQVQSAAGIECRHTDLVSRHVRQTADVTSVSR